MAIQIIYLNGPTSVGKTTLAKALQQALHHHYLLFGLDTMINMMPGKTNDWQHCTPAPGFSICHKPDIEGHAANEVHTGPFGYKVIKSLLHVAKTLAVDGHYLIIDDVAFGKGQVDQWRKTFEGYTVLWVGLTAPIEIIEAREKNRGDRTPGTARWQLERVHKGVKYDLMIDTDQLTTEQQAKKIKSLVE